MKYLSDDDSGYISPVSDEIESICSRNSSCIGSVVSRKFEITFEVSDLIVVSAEECFSQSVGAITSVAGDSPCHSNASIHSRKLGRKENICKKKKKNQHHQSRKKGESSKIEDDLVNFDTLDIIEHKTEQKSHLPLNASIEKKLDGNMLGDDISSKSCIDIKYREFPFQCSKQNSESNSVDVSEQSGYISPASSEDEERKKMMNYKTYKHNESTGYVSSISDDILSEDSDCFSNDENSVVVEHGVYLMNIDLLSENSKIKKSPKNRSFTPHCLEKDRNNIHENSNVVTRRKVSILRSHNLNYDYNSLRY